MTLSAPAELARGGEAGLSDEALWVHFARQGCELSLNVLHRRYQHRLHLWIQHCGVRDVERAADLVQETWIRLLNHRRRFDPARKWRTWAYHVARNLAKNEGRRLGRMRVTPESHFARDSGEMVQVGCARSTSLPDEMMRARHLAETLAGVLARIPEEQRSVFTLRFIDGRSYAEVSRLLGVPCSALTSKAKRVRLKVRQEMRLLLDDAV